MRKYLIPLLAVLLVSSCTRDLTTSEIRNELTEITLTASLDDVVKQNLSGGKVTWEEGDKIMVCFDQYSNQFEFTLNPEDAGKTTGRFSGYFSADIMNQYGPLHAVYPSSVVADRYYLDYLTISLPSTQYYREGSFGTDANICMCTTSDIGQTLSFRNTGGLLKLTIQGSVTISSIVLSSASDNLTGDCYILKTADESGDNFIFLDQSTTPITLDCGDGVQLNDTGKDFYIYAPYGTLANGYTVEIKDTDGGKMIKRAPASKLNMIQRSKILSMPAFTYEKSKYANFCKKRVPGEYSSPAGSCTLKTSFLSDGGQCGIDSGSEFNLRNWDKGTSTDYSVPTDAELVDANRGLAWYVSKDGTTGYVVASL